MGTAADMLLWLVRAGVEASAVAGLVLLVQWLLRKRVSARWRYNLWFLVVARLLLPAVPGTPLSPFNLFDFDAVRKSRSVLVGLDRPVRDATEAQGRSAAAQSDRPAAKPVDVAARRSASTAAERGKADRRLRLRGSVSAPLTGDPGAGRRLIREAASGDPGDTPIAAPIDGAVEPPAPVAATADLNSPPSSHGRVEAGKAPAPSHVEPLTAAARPAPAPRIDWPLVAVFVWLTGAALLAARLAWSSVRLAVAVRRMPSADDPEVARLLQRCMRQLGVGRAPQLLLGPDELGPALVGLLRPRLLLPAGALPALDGRELRLVLLHELAHLKRRDVAVNWLLAGLQVVHWFNPLLWLAFARMRADRELACDEAVLSAASRDEARAYGPAVIKLLQVLAFGPRGAAAEPAGAVGMLGVLDGKAHLRRRITMIARFNPSVGSRRWSVAGLALSLLLGGVALTGAVRADDEPRAPDAPLDAAAPEELPPLAGVESQPELPPVTVPSPPGSRTVDPAAPRSVAPAAGAAPPGASNAPALAPRPLGASLDAPSAEVARIAEGDVIEILIAGADGRMRVLQMSIVDDEGFAPLSRGARVRAAGLTEEQLIGAVFQAIGDKLPGEAGAFSVRLTRCPREAGDPLAAPALPTPELAPSAGVEFTAPRADPAAELPDVPRAPGGLTPPVPQPPGVESYPGPVPVEPAQPRPGRNNRNRFAPRPPGYGVPPGRVGPNVPSRPGGGSPPYGAGAYPGRAPAQPYPAESHEPAARIEDAEAREADAATAAKLRKPVDIDFTDKPLAEALDYLADAADVTVFPDWRALEAAGVARDTPVTLRVKGRVPAERALRWLVKAGGGDVAGWALDSGVVVVSNRDQLAAMTITRAYDVNDLFTDEANRMAATFPGAEKMRESVPQMAGQSLVELIGETVPTGPVRVFGGQMIITATEPNHREVQKLFDLLRGQPKSASDGETWPRSGVPGTNGAPGGLPGGGGTTPAPLPKGPTTPRGLGGEGSPPVLPQSVPPGGLAPSTTPVEASN